MTRDDRWPARAAAFLHRVGSGDLVEGWVLPHPHRVPSGPGLAVVTGSGAAGVFAALRAGARGIRMLWGVGDKQLASPVGDELATWASDGAATVDLARSPARVTDLLDLGAARTTLETSGWLYVSGNKAMGRDVDTVLRAAIGDEPLDRAARQLRYIVST